MSKEEALTAMFQDLSRRLKVDLNTENLLCLMDVFKTARIVLGDYLLTLDDVSEGKKRLIERDIFGV